MNIEMSMEDYIIILNALHYYKKADKKGHFKQYDTARINKLRDSLADQICPSDCRVFTHDDLGDNVIK